MVGVLYIFEGGREGKEGRRETEILFISLEAGVLQS